MKVQQHGFTLIELMISLAIGLIVVAAAIVLFISSQKSIALQQGASDIQDNSNFALNYIAKDIRMANLGNTTASMTNSTVNGGIVLAKANLSAASTVNENLFSRSKVSNTSAVDVDSDQLVIQYLPIVAGGFDCEGNAITSTSEYVIQRYFVRKDSNFSADETEDTALALVCDAGRYSGNAATNFGDDGQIVMKRVDYFHVLLVTENSSGSFRDMSIEAYKAMAAKPRILGVKIGVLARSSQSVGDDPNIDVSQPFNVLGQTVTLNSTVQNSATKKLRDIIVQTVAIRNALGAR
ncbi:prepilin-type N-terminal cleavage/methylation domain-containing protein [Acinetobacter sp. CWB-B33]|jgi:type IV pilus assembly protein PilW|uniref:prepilin-type N-terminal cleavage/methylation domain-containing protein n=1 Tax=Acinetobacter sp. CWB-B33 TaxID=2815724 RepID=UPI0031FE8CC9